MYVLRKNGALEVRKKMSTYRALWRILARLDSKLENKAKYVMAASKCNLLNLTRSKDTSSVNIQWYFDS